MAKKILCGLTIVLLGVCVLLDNFDVINFTLSLGKIWPIIVLLLGVGNVLDNKKVDFGSIVLLIIGGYSLLRNFGYVTVPFMKLIFPILVIILGLAIMLPKKDLDKNTEVEMKNIKNDVMLNAIFSGSESRSESKELRKVEMTAVFGGTTLDLRKASTKNGKCVCYATGIFGGIDIIADDDWNVNMDGVTCIFGGVDNKRKNNPDAKNTLYVKGLVAFGGIEVK